MRFLLTILLILSFGYSNGQQVINAHVRYRGFVQNNLLLDLYPGAAAAYSLRKLDKDYTGSAIRVRKDTTGQPEQDIGFLGNELDTVSLKSFLNARSGFVVTWYDQSGNLRNGTQSTQANQPRIALNGIIDILNGKPSVIFDGSNDHLVSNDLGSAFSGTDVPVSVLFVAAYLTNETEKTAFSWSSHTSNTPLRRFSSTTTTAHLWWHRDNVGAIASTSATAGVNTNMNNWNFFHTGTAISISVNGVLTRDAVSNDVGATTTTRFTIGGALRTSFGLASNISASELIIYPDNQILNRASFESNINTFYGIY